jgi:hypothetical protein
MSEKVRRVRLLLAVCTAGLLAFVVAWPSQSAATEPPPLYLARDATPQPGETEADLYFAVGDGPRLVAHVLRDREDIADLEVIDSAGRVVDLRPNGEVVATGSVVEPAVVKTWLQNAFHLRWLRLEPRLGNGSIGENCAAIKQATRGRLTLPTHQGARELTLAETFVETDVRLVALHNPENGIPDGCFRRFGSTPPHHRAGFLHNLMHRITGTSGNNN